jgi:hypothetical protein
MQWRAKTSVDTKVVKKLQESPGRHATAALVEVATVISPLRRQAGDEVSSFALQMTPAIASRGFEQRKVEQSTGARVPGSEPVIEPFASATAFVLAVPAAQGTELASRGSSCERSAPCRAAGRDARCRPHIALAALQPRGAWKRRRSRISARQHRRPSTFPMRTGRGSHRACSMGCDSHPGARGSRRACLSSSVCTLPGWLRATPRRGVDRRVRARPGRGRRPPIGVRKKRSCSAVYVEAS